MGEKVQGANFVLALTIAVNNSQWHYFWPQPRIGCIHLSTSTCSVDNQISKRFTGGRQNLWSDCVNAQADLCFPWADITRNLFSCCNSCYCEKIRQILVCIVFLSRALESSLIIIYHSNACLSLAENNTIFHKFYMLIFNYAEQFHSNYSWNKPNIIFYSNNIMSWDSCAGLCKQFRPWSDAAECGIWSGSTMFATQSSSFRQIKR